MNTLHLSLTRKKFARGQVISKEGEPCDNIYIILKGEFEVSKVIDTSKINEKFAKPSKQLDL